jgi:hypothetical protein
LPAPVGNHQDSDRDLRRLIVYRGDPTTDRRTTGSASVGEFRDRFPDEIMELACPQIHGHEVTFIDPGDAGATQTL